jgi:ribosomal protein S18 acetylase RimI-like enzyme
MNESADGEIRLPDAPAAPGLRFRAFAGPADYPAMVRILNDVAADEDVEPFWTEQLLADYDGAAPHFDPRRDRLIAEIDGAMIGAGRVQSERTVTGERLYLHSFNIDPTWKGRGISRAVLRYHERRLRAMAATHADEAGPRYLAPYGINDVNTNAVELMLAEGYAPARYGCEMIRAISGDEQIPELPLPAGIDVRPVREEHVRAMWEAKEEAFRDLWGFIPSPPEAFEVFRNDPTWRRDLTAVAWDGDEVVGQVMCFISDSANRQQGRQRAWTEQICVRRPWRRKGVAHALISRVLRAIQREGMSEAALGVDTDNPSGALRLYQSMGYREKSRATWFRKALTP